MKHCWVRSFAASALVFVLIGCGGGESSAAVPGEGAGAQPLTVEVSGSGVVASSPLGIVCGSKCEASFAADTTVSLAAKPTAGWMFTGWGGPCSGTGACILKANAAKTVTATFVQGGYVLTLSRVGSGNVKSVPGGINCGMMCGTAFAAGTRVSLQPTPVPGYRFSGWSGACTGTQACSVLMSAAKAVTATFVADTSPVLSVSVGAGGSVSSSPAGINCGSTCSAPFAANSTVTLTAAPSSGYRFSAWSGACTGSGSCSVTMSGSKSVSASFVSTAGSMLSVSVDGDGTVTSAPSGISCGSDCSQSYTSGTTVTLTAAAGAGKTFSGWSGACSGSSATCRLTMSGSTEVKAAFSGGVALDGACKSFYGAGFELVEGQIKAPWTTSAKPARGVSQRESAFKTCEVRVTDHRSDGVPTFARNDYSRRQAFNADSTRQLVYALDGSWHLYDNSYSHLGSLPYAVAADAEPQWHPSDPDLLYYLPTNGVGMKVYSLQVSSGKSTLIGDLASRLKARWPGANAAWTKSEGSPSADGRYWCFLVDSASWQGLGLVTWDRNTDTILGYKDLNGTRPDHVSMSPSGNYCVSSSYGGPGVVVYNRDFSTSRKIANVGEHSDIGIDANGDDAYVSVDYQADKGDIFMVNLRTGARTNLFASYVNGSTSAFHFSGKAFRKPGWFVVSTYGESGGQQWLHRKVMVVQMAANPKIYNLAHTQDEYDGYWTAPVASTNRDLTKVVWNSNWHIRSDTDVDTYMVQIPPDSLKR
jgi:Divergent InlB B-repeat domain